MKGKGIAKGLKLTFKRFFQKNLTEQYPDVQPTLSPRYRGKFKLKRDECIACTLCEKACPNKVITIESERNEETKKKNLTKFEMDMGRCLYCGFCTEACPTKALKSTQTFETAVYSKKGTKDDLIKED